MPQPGSTHHALAAGFEALMPHARIAGLLLITRKKTYKLKVGNVSCVGQNCSQIASSTFSNDTTFYDFCLFRL